MRARHNKVYVERNRSDSVGLMQRYTYTKLTSHALYANTFVVLLPLHP